MKKCTNEGGFSLVELTVAMTVLAIAAISFFALFSSLVHSTIVAKRQAVALTVATNQMEYLKSLPYDNLIVIGGSIPGTGTIPATSTQTINGVKYTITTSIDYVDDAYDYCATYPDVTTMLRECRGSTSANFTADTTKLDKNRGDYKLGHVKVTDPSGSRLAEVDTQISAKIAEAASTKGALFVKIIDDSGNIIPDATVTVTNSTVVPSVNQTVTTDNFGLAIFYEMPPDNATDYYIQATKNGYSTLTTIKNFGSLQPTYPNQNMISQQASYVTLTLKPQGVNSLIIEAVDTSGNPLPGLKVYVKGGYKKYTDPTNTAYYYDNMSPADTRPSIGGDGMAVLNNLVPGTYIFCDDKGDTGCATGSSYNLVAAIPYGGDNSLSPIIVPTYQSSSPPAITYPYSGNQYLQKVRLVLSQNANFPRVFGLAPSQISKTTTNLSNFAFTITGQKLSCGNGAGCSSSVKFVQGPTQYIANCNGGSGGTTLTCTVNLTGVAVGDLQLVVGTNGGTLALPTDPLGGLDVRP